MAYEILNNQQMADADRLTIEGGTPGFELMRRAGAGVANFIHLYYPDCRILALCGPGNNGGDGFAAAKRLKEKGREVRLACLVPKEKLKGDALRAAQEWTGDISAFENLKIQPDELIIDAVFGTGLARDFTSPAKEVFLQIESSGSEVVAVDIPSGVNGNTGEVLPHAPRARHTVTFCRKKTGHVLLPGRAHSGTVHVIDIGISDHVVNQAGCTAVENGPHAWRSCLVRKTPAGHKYDYGHVVILGGSRMTGASCMAAHAAMRIGAGLCTIAAAPEAANIYRNFHPNILFEAIDEPASFGRILSDRRRNAILIGPGAGLENTEGLKKAVETSCGLPDKKIILDADALTVFKDDPDMLHRILHQSNNAVITPHEGEFAAIFPDVKGTKIERAKLAAKKTNAIVVLKGFESVIANPDGKCVVNTCSSPYLATAGSGDVLAGFIAGLTAQGVPLFESSCAAVWLHSKASCIFGPCLVATDIADIIPAMMNHLI